MSESLDIWWHLARQLEAQKHISMRQRAVQKPDVSCQVVGSGTRGGTGRLCAAGTKAFVFLAHGCLSGIDAVGLSSTHTASFEYLLCLGFGAGMIR